MKKILLGLVGLFMALSVHAVDLREAEVALSKGQLERANEIATMALNDNPKSGRAHMILAYAFGKQGYSTAAQKELMLAEQLDHNGTVVRSPLAKKVYAMLPEHKALTVSAAPTQELRAIVPASENPVVAVKFSEELRPASVANTSSYGQATALEEHDNGFAKNILLLVFLCAMTLIALLVWMRHWRRREEESNTPNRRFTDPQGTDFFNDPVQRVLRRTTESGTPTYETRSNPAEVQHHHHDNTQQSGVSATAAGLTGLVAGGVIGAVAATAVARDSEDRRQEQSEVELEESRRKDRHRREEEQASVSSGSDSEVWSPATPSYSFSPSRVSEETSRTHDTSSRDFSSGSDSGSFDSGSD